MKTRAFSRLALLTGLIVMAAPSALWACTTCFNRSDAPMAHGMNMGIYTLLGVLGVVTAGAITFFVFLARRASAHSETDESTNP